MMSMNIQAIAVSAADGSYNNSDQHEIKSIAFSVTNLQHCEPEGSGFLLCIVMAMRCRGTTVFWI